MEFIENHVSKKATIFTTQSISLITEMEIVVRPAVRKPPSGQNPTRGVIWICDQIWL